MRKIISISLICITVLFALTLTGCSFDTKDIMEGIQKLEQMEQEAKENQENSNEETGDVFTKKDNELKAMVDQNRSILKEIDWKLAHDEDRGTGDVLKYWTGPLAFDGFQGAGANVKFMSFLPDDCYFGQSLDIDALGEKCIDYRLNFFEDYSQINVDSIVLKLDGIFGIDIDKEVLKTTIEDYKTKLAENTEEDKVVGSYILYDENDIVIKISAINNKGTEFIAVVGYYLNPYYNN